MRQVLPPNRWKVARDVADSALLANWLRKAKPLLNATKATIRQSLRATSWHCCQRICWRQQILGNWRNKKAKTHACTSYAFALFYQRVHHVDRPPRLSCCRAKPPPTPRVSFNLDAFAWVGYMSALCERHHQIRTFNATCGAKTSGGLIEANKQSIQTTPAPVEDSKYEKVAEQAVSSTLWKSICASPWFELRSRRRQLQTPEIRPRVRFWKTYHLLRHRRVLLQCCACSWAEYLARCLVVSFTQCAVW